MKTKSLVSPLFIMVYEVQRVYLKYSQSSTLIKKKKNFFCLLLELIANVLCTPLFIRDGACAESYTS